MDPREGADGEWRVDLAAGLFVWGVVGLAVVGLVTVVRWIF